MIEVPTQQAGDVWYCARKAKWYDVAGSALMAQLASRDARRCAEKAEGRS